MPNIFLIARTKFNAEEFGEFLLNGAMDWTRTSAAGDAQDLVEAAGRVCYMSFGTRQSPKTNEDYIRHLIRSGHESVLEHVNWTFVIDGVTRAFTHQLVRHRVGFAFSQLSQQYHDESEAEFIEPPHLAHFPKAMTAWKDAMEAARKAYLEIKLAGMDEEVRFGLEGKNREALRAVRSMARSVLPNATETKIVVTANARALRHFLKVRGTIPGDLEMREVSAAILKLVQKEAPALFFDFHIDQLSDSTPIVVHQKT